MSVYEEEALLGVTDSANPGNPKMGKMGGANKLGSERDPTQLSRATLCQLIMPTKVTSHCF